MSRLKQLAVDTAVNVLKIVWLSYDALILRCHGELFCLLFNVRARLLLKDAVFSYDKETRRFAAKSKDNRQYFYSKSQAVNAYRYGLAERAEKLAKVYFLDQISFSDADTVIDCGGNVGDLYMYFKARHPNINYIGIEPSPSEYECLSLNVEPHQTHNLGLWNQDGEMKFYISSGGADSSFIEPPFWDEFRVVPSKRLDSLVTGRIKLLKLEAEGAEPEVIEGATELLPWIEYISADLGFERGATQLSTLVPVINFLLERDFTLVDLSQGRIVALFRNNAIRS